MKFKQNDFGKVYSFESSTDMLVSLLDEVETLEARHYMIERSLGCFLDTLANKGLLTGREVIQIIRGYDDKDIEVVE